MDMTGTATSVGMLDIQVIRGTRAAEKPAPVRRKAPLRWRIRNWFRKLFSGEFFAYLFVVCLAPLLRWLVPGIGITCSRLDAIVTHADGSITDYGCLGYHLVVTAGKNFLAACMDNTSEPEVLKYHGFGTGTTAASSGQTALVTELTTEYATDNTRPTGSQAHSGATYTTVATLSPDSGGTIAVTEWGLFSQAANSGGTMFDRQVFSAINLTASADSLTPTYVLTFS